MTDGLFTIEIPIGGVSIQDLRPIVQHFDCKIRKSSGDYFFISSDDPKNFYWLGMNLLPKLQGDFKSGITT